MIVTTSGSVVVTEGSAVKAVASGRRGFESLAEAIDAVAAVDALLASLAASRAVLMSEVGAWAAGHVEEIAEEWLPGPDGAEPPADEIAAGIVAGRLADVLRVSPEGAASLVEESRVLVHQHPRTLAALRSGKITYGHAQTILGYTCGLHRGGRTALETRLLRYARTATVAELSGIARIERERRLRTPRPGGHRRAAEGAPGAEAKAGAGAGTQRRQSSSQAGGSPAWT
ncbi:DUF222 domain-containing protein [Myceligenerans crystallogenes]|uniref:DUF222 domain-containing protein n=1 Tax=Myceligenerans crystallogenes TaxID=316335 RepID=A0ABP4ZRA7_9MICO